MDLTVTQRNISFALAQRGYIGNWYKNPTKIFLKVYLHDTSNDIYVRISISVNYEVYEMVFDDSTKPFGIMADEDCSKFNGVITAITSICPKAFVRFASSI